MMRDMCWIFYEDEDTCNLIISQSDTIYTMMNREDIKKIFENG